MIDVVLNFDGEPFPKGRPRFTCIRNKPHVYTDAKTLAAEEELAWRFRCEMVGEPTQQDVALRAHFRVKSKKSDLDNLVKTVLDAANGIVFNDDRQVVSIDATLERVTSNPSTYLSIQEVNVQGVEVAA